MCLAHFKNFKIKISSQYYNMSHIINNAIMQELSYEIKSIKIIFNTLIHKQKN